MTFLTAAIALGLVVLGTGAVAAEPSEPPGLEGVWVGTWWMGKYEEPIEMELVQRGSAVSGRVAMVGYPAVGVDGHASENAVIQSGRLDGEQLVLTWHIGGRRFTAALVWTPPGTLFGLGSEDGQVTTGLGLNRAR